MIRLAKVLLSDGSECYYSVNGNDSKIDIGYDCEQKMRNNQDYRKVKEVKFIAPLNTLGGEELKLNTF